MSETETPNSPVEVVDIIEHEAYVAVNEINTLVIKAPHIVGITGNAQRSVPGTLVASVGEPSIGIKQALTEAIPLNMGHETLDGNRQVAINDLCMGKDYQLYLELAEDYHLPLSIDRPVRANFEADLYHFSAPTWLVPILPRMYQNNQLDMTDANHFGVPTTGFIYVFIDGHLWREVGIIADTDNNTDNNTYQLQEINLDQGWGLDSRARVIDLPDDTILVPQCLGGRSDAPVIEIAHSMVQWSWRQIEALGGLHPQDLRVKGREQAPASDKAERLRQERLQQLGNMLHWTGERWYHTEAVASHRDYHLPQVPLFNPLAIALSHTAECASALKDLMDSYQTLADDQPHYASAEVLYRFAFDASLWERSSGRDLEGLNDEITAAFDGRFPHLYEYRAHLDKQYGHLRHSRIIQDKLDDYFALRRDRRSPRYQRRDSGARFVRGLRDRIDEGALNQCLFPERIKDKVAALEAARAKHFQWLDEKTDHGVNIRYTLNERHVRLHAALADYANLSSESEDNHWLEFLNLFMLLMLPLHGKKTSVSDLYDLMERLSPEKNPTEDVGVQWLKPILADEQHPIHRMLLPTSDILDATRVYPSANSLPDIPFDGSGRFRPKDFAKAVKLAIERAEAEGAGPSRLASADNSADTEANNETSDAAQSAVGEELFSREQKILALPIRVVDDFYQWIGELFDPASPYYRLETHTTPLIYTRLMQSAQLPEFKSTHMILAGQTVDTQKYIVLGANHLRMQAMNTKAMTPERVEAFMREGQGVDERVTFVDAATGEKVGDSLISQTMNYSPGTEAPEPGAPFDAKSLWSYTGKDRGRGLTQIRAEVDVLVMDIDSYTAMVRANLAVANQDLSAPNVHRGYSAGVVGGRGVAAMLSLLMLRLEWGTLRGIMGGALGDRSVQQYGIAMGTALASLLAATGEASIATATLIGKADLAEKLDNITFGKFRWGSRLVNLTVFKTLGAVASSITSVLSTIDAYEHFKRSDHDAAFALSASALVGGALATIGAAALLECAWALAVPNPIVWALIAVSIGLAVLASYWRDKPLEDWVLHGPFGKKAFNGSYNKWENNPNDCYQALMSQLIQPTVTLEEGENEGRPIAVVKINLPYYIEGKDELMVHTTCQDEYWDLNAHKRGLYANNSSFRPETVCTPYNIVKHRDARNIINCLEYHYAIDSRAPDDLPHAMIHNQEWRARVQLKTQGITLPCEYKPGLYDNQPEETPTTIDKDQLRWTHPDEYLELTHKLT